MEGEGGGHERKGNNNKGAGAGFQRGGRRRGLQQQLCAANVAPQPNSCLLGQASGTLQGGDWSTGMALLLSTPKLLPRKAQQGFSVCSGNVPPPLCFHFQITIMLIIPGYENKQKTQRCSLIFSDVYICPFYTNQAMPQNDIVAT